MGVQHPDQVRLQLCGQVVDLLYRDAPHEHAGEGLPGCDQSAVKPLYPHYLTIPPQGRPLLVTHSIFIMKMLDRMEERVRCMADIFSVLVMFARFCCGGRFVSVNPVQSSPDYNT